MALFGIGGKGDGGGLKPIVQRAPTTPAVSSLSSLLVQPKAVVRTPAPPPVVAQPAPAALRPPAPPPPPPVFTRVEAPKPPAPVETPKFRLVPPTPPAAPPPPVRLVAAQDAPKPKAAAAAPPPVTWGPPAAPAVDLSHLRRAVVLQAKGEHEAAILHFAKAIAADPLCTEAHAGRGISKEALGDVDGARRDYCKSVELEVKQGIARHLATAPELSV